MKKIIFLCLPIWLFFIATSVQAQSIGLRISPPRFEYVAEPGKIIEDYIKLTNESEVSKTLFPYLKDFKAEGENGVARLIPPGSEEGAYLASWIEIDPAGLDFSPQETKQIPFKIKVPGNIGPGGYYGAVVFGTEPPRLYQNSEERGAGMSVAQQTSSLVLLRVKGEIYEEAAIREFITDKEIYGTPFSVAFTARIENLGNVHVKPNGFITIKNMLGKKVAEIDINETQANILPRSIRRFTQNWSGQRAFGRYTAELGFNYGAAVDKGGQGKQTLFTSKTFWIMPWKLVLLAGLGIAIGLVLIILALRFYRNRAIASALAQAGLRSAGRRKYRGPSRIWHFILLLGALLVIALLFGVVLYFLIFA